MNQDSAFPWVPKEQIGGQRFQGQSLPAGCQIPRAEIADGGDAGALRDDGGHADFQRRGEAAIVFLPCAMAGTADAENVRQAETCPIGHLPSSCRESLSEQPVQEGDLPGIAGCRCLQDQAAKVTAIRTMNGLRDPRLQSQAGALHFQQAASTPSRLVPGARPIIHRDVIRTSTVGSTGRGCLGRTGKSCKAYMIRQNRQPMECRPKK